MAFCAHDELLPLLIGGDAITTTDVIESRSPARPDEIVGRVCGAGPEEVRAAFAAARSAQQAWAGRSAVERATVIMRAADIVEQREESIAREMAREMGKAVAESLAEVRRAATIMRFHAGDAVQPSGTIVPSANAATLLYAVREPVGVVGLITPWNFPIAIPAWKLAPALVHGNAVVLKPSTDAPLGAYRLAEALLEAGVPAGVLNVVCGRSSRVSDALTSAPELDALSFTGSTGVGATLREALASRNVRLQLELGGHNPAVVLDDADVEVAVAAIVDGAMASTGQKCTATRRVIVLPGIYERFVARLVDAVGALRVGDPLDPATDVGPLASEAQYRDVLQALEVARDEGHAVAVGGIAIGGEGWFVAPTVLLDVDPTSRTAQEEIFGPVLSVQRAVDFDDAIALANGTAFGLSASIFTQDLDAALGFVGRVRAGVVHVNESTTGSEPQAPFGGVKASGSGHREQGKTAVEFYTNLKTVSIARKDIAGVC